MGGGRGAFCYPGGVQGNAPDGGQGTLPPETEGFYLNLRYKKNRFPALYPVSNSHSQNTLYCTLSLSSRGTNQAQTIVYVQRLYTPNINNKGCTRNHPSFCSYVLVYVGRSSYQQLTTDSTRGEKRVWSLYLPQETKYPRSVMNDIKVCLATN